MRDLFVFACKHDVNWLKESHGFQYITLEGCPKNESLGYYDESRAYLEFIIDNYWDLPEKVVFVHGHSRAWHYNSPLHERLKYIAGSRYFTEKDFGGIYCNTNNAFAPSNWAPSIHIPPQQLWNMTFWNASIKMPTLWNYPCCGTFFVRSTAIRSRSHEVYKQLLQNMENVPMYYKKNRIAGRVMESAWKTLFAPHTVYEPPDDCRRG